MATEQDERPPGPDGLPFVGNTHQFAPNPLEFYTELAREYGPVAYFEAGGTEFYQLSDPDDIEHVLVHNNQQYRKGEVYEQSLGPIVGEGLLLSEGEFWRDQRHRMQPAFGPEALDSYAPIMVEFTEQLAERWTDGEVRDVHADMMQLTVEIAAKALFDVDISDDERQIAEALESVMDRSESRIKRPVDVPDWVPLPENLRYRRALETIEGIADDIIADHEPGSDNVVSMLLLAAQESDELTHERIRDEVVTLLLAGHETTALALTYTLYLLANNPEQTDTFRTAVREELDGGAPTKADLEHLPEAEHVVKEGMRVYPPVQGIIREATEPDEIGGYRIPEGATISIEQWVMHRDPRFFDDPTAFRPKRWDDGLESEIPSFAYFPFGGGPRRCIGDHFAMLETQLALADLVQDWAFEPVTEELEFSPSLTLRPEAPVELRVSRL